MLIDAMVDAEQPKPDMVCLPRKAVIKLEGQDWAQGARKADGDDEAILGPDTRSHGSQSRTTSLDIVPCIFVK